MIVPIIMTVVVGAVMISPLALGVVMLYRGLRGRMLDHYPRCRRCGYVTLRQTRDTRPRLCSECGADLRLPDAVRYGRRFPRMGLVAAAVALIQADVILLVAGAMFLDDTPVVSTPTPVCVVGGAPTRRVFGGPAWRRAATGPIGRGSVDITPPRRRGPRTHMPTIVVERAELANAQPRRSTPVVSGPPPPPASPLAELYRDVRPPQGVRHASSIGYPLRVGVPKKRFALPVRLNPHLDRNHRGAAKLDVAMRHRVASNRVQKVAHVITPR